MRLQTWADEGDRVPTVIRVWPTADWHEREQFDLMGIVFDGHPNLQRILLDDDWEGHPLRKDYPLGGEPVRFSGRRSDRDSTDALRAGRSTKVRGSRIRSRRC